MRPPSHASQDSHWRAWQLLRWPALSPVTKTTDTTTLELVGLCSPITAVQIVLVDRVSDPTDVHSFPPIVLSCQLDSQHYSAKVTTQSHLISLQEAILFLSCPCSSCSAPYQGPKSLSIQIQILTWHSLFDPSLLQTLPTQSLCHT